MLGVIVHVNNRPIGSVYIHNVDKLAGDVYEYTVLDTGVGGEEDKCYTELFIEHKRSDGWKPLVIKALQRLLEEEGS